MANPPKKMYSILILSRPLSNTLDEGSKNLVYYISRICSYPIRVLIESGFKLPVSKSVSFYELTTDINSTYVENSRSKSVKMRLMTELLKVGKYNCVHAFFSLTKINSLILLFVRLILRKKVILSIPAIQENKLNSFIVKITLRNVSQLVVMSEKTALKVKSLAPNVEVIESIVDETRFKPCTEGERRLLRDKLEITAKHVVIYPGEYGRLDSNENIVSIVKGVIEKMGTDVQFIFSCRIKTSHDLKIEKHVKQELQGCNVLFLNTVSNYHEYAMVSDIGVFPVKNMDGKFDHPLALVELMALGKPVYHSNIEPLDELYSGSPDFCLPYENTQLFIERIVQSFTDKVAYQKAVNQTLLETQKFSASTNVKKYENIYERLC